ncbi:hypothetical protein GLOIN_2v1532005 [Rhizophagus irregularis DAOM 181602=DAOM 197198]|nr:hypothetical protein GLOIN_2v1532005 [Rhizophagus irregularis DAOM 181602=DAOM 197198]
MASFASEVISIFLIIYFFHNLISKEILIFICSSVILRISIFSFINEDVKFGIRELHS